MPTTSDQTSATAPTTNGSATLAEDTALRGTLASTAARGVYAKATEPAHGRLELSPDGRYVYIPAANYHGTDSFAYTVSSVTPELSGTLAALSAAGGTVASDAALAAAAAALAGSAATPGTLGSVVESVVSATNVPGTAAVATLYTQRLVITPVNDAPVLSAPVPEQRATAGTAYSYTLASNAFTDVDSAVLTYRAAQASGAALPSWLSFDAETRTFSGTPGATDAGALVLKLSASDGSAVASATFALRVGASLDTVTPTIALSSDRTQLAAGESARIGFTLSEPSTNFTEGDVTVAGGRLSNFEGSGTSYSATFTPAATTAGVAVGGALIAVASGRFTDAAGNPNVDGADADNRLVLTFASAPAVPPATGGDASATLAEDTVLRGTLAGATSTGSASGAIATSIYTRVSAPEHGRLELDPAGRYVYVPAANYAGTDSFTYTVTSPLTGLTGTLTNALTSAATGAGSAGAATQPVVYTQRLVITPVNDAPVPSAPIVEQRATAGTAYSYTLASNAFTDVDSPVLTYGAVQANGAALPSWLSFNADTRTFSGTPGAADAGGLAIRVTASDGALDASTVFPLRVAVASSAPQTAREDDRVRLLESTAGDDFLDGAGTAGVAMVRYAGTRAQYSLDARERGVEIRDSVSGRDGTDIATNVQRLQFSDTRVALDFEGSARDAALLMGAVLGRTSLSDRAMTGAVLNYLDAGNSLSATIETLVGSGLVAGLAGGSDSRSLVALVYRNVVGGDAPAPLVDMLAGVVDQMGQSAFLTAIASSPLNETSVDLIGLRASGLEYL
jgi:hypothetical protein